MIIRHDLKIVFIHIPKCAGKEIRKIMKHGSTSHNCTEMWNYEYNNTVERYVDRAHLPMSDLRVYKEFKYIRKYTVIACVRNPYLRLRSAIREFYRQKSKATEILVKEGKVTKEMERFYLDKIRNRHAMLDPRYIHSLPMYRFTHYGEKPKIDYFMRCESLKEDFLKIAEKIGLPLQIKNEGIRSIKNEDQSKELSKCSQEVKLVAEKLYKKDFRTFGYICENLYKSKKGNNWVEAGEVNELFEAERVRWHWGPEAEKKYNELRMSK